MRERFFLGRSAIGALAMMALVACSDREQAPADAFFGRLGALCSQAFVGRVVSTDSADAAFATADLVMHVRECTDTEIRVPFHVGENRSRTWVLTRTDDGLRLKHDHRHEDGGEDAITMYGGDTAGPGTASRQEFPADAFSKALFVRENIPVSVDNVWAIDVEPRRVFAYELRRPNRHFRVEFDLTKPITPPPPPWGAPGH